jgi:hypothetical protein
MAISENVSLRVSRQPESGGEFSESTAKHVPLAVERVIQTRASIRWTALDLRKFGPLIRSGRLYEGSDPQDMIAEYLDDVASAEAHHASLLANAYESVALPSA